jgi:transglutaminase-like putative cysteine protease
MFKLEEGWLTVALLCAMVTVSGSGVAAAGWTESLQAVWLCAVVGVCAGLALARSRFNGPVVLLFALVYGLFVVGFFIGLDLEGDWHRRSLELVIRLNNFIYKAIYGGTSRDFLPFPVSVSLIYWFIGVLSAYSVFKRGTVWPAVIPAGVGLLINAYYYLGPVRLDLYLAVYVLLALMFVARMNLLDREREWQTARVLYSTDLRLDFLRAGLAAALAGVLIAWAAPSLAASPQAASTWRQMTGSLSVIRESWMRMFAAIRGYGQAYSDFYGDMLTLSGPARLSTEPIMDVTVSLIANPDEALETGIITGQIQRFYWRAVTYANYGDGRWEPGEVEYKEFDPNRTHLQQPAYLQRRQVSVAFTMHVPASSRLYVAQQMLWMDRPSTLELAFDPVGSHDVSSARAQQVVRRGETYQVISSISVADQISLNEAGKDYPQWVRDSYLQLPSSVTPRTRELAQQIVDDAGAETPFEQAEAITDWLRANIVYDQQIDAPPPDEEPVDYLLFTSRRGYCNYYASAEVVLLRSLGIPARMAAGMSQGQLDPRSNVYHVLEQNAHAWPEVYFPRYGWVEFEPTASEAPIVRPERVAAEDTSNQDVSNDPEDTESLIDRENRQPEIPPDDSGSTAITWQVILRRIPWTGILVTLAALAVAVVVAAVFSFRVGMVGLESMGRAGRAVLRARGMALPAGVALVYLQLERVAEWLGLTSGPATTPNERAQALGDFAPSARPGVETITAQYVTEKYSPHGADVTAAETAWHGVRFKLWHDAIQSWLLALLEDGEDEDPLGLSK